MQERLRAWGPTKIVRIASCVILNENAEILLLKRHPDDLGGNKWGFPGGRVEPKEDPSETVIREVKEETGLELDDVLPLGKHGVGMPHGAVQLSSFRTVVDSRSDIVLDPVEHVDYLWLPLGDVLTNRDLLWGIPSVLRDFDFIPDFTVDPTLSDGSSAVLLD
ncbi:MAG TPA: NUDIX hydrolase [Candidatus Saccharimonadia bacterium]|nr:NUDIX hydrolase [Candidatus Saccharimonadia bacterium]